MSQEQHLIVGLGNPESDYADTRHNLGFACVRELARRLDVKVDRKRWQSLVGRSEARRVWFVLPQTYMNLSGEAVAKALRDTKLIPEQLWVVHDELDLPLCRLRIKRGGSRAGRSYVLGRFTKAEAERLPSIVDGVADALELALEAGMERAMERFNRAGSLGCEELR